jgi:hypothetical protein
VTISFPLSMPTTRQPAHIDWIRESNVGSSESPFSFSPQAYVWGAERWRTTLAWGTMGAADANDVEGFLLALNGPEGSFLFGDPLRPAPLGTWAGQSPLCAGAGTSRAKTLAIDGLTAASTGKRGDWFQLGSGSTSRLYRLTADFTANGSGQVTLDFWPGLREAPADNAPLTLASAKGLFMLAGNAAGWSQEDVRDFGISLECVEDLRAL